MLSDILWVYVHGFLQHNCSLGFLFYFLPLHGSMNKSLARKMKPRYALKRNSLSKCNMNYGL